MDSESALESLAECIGLLVHEIERLKEANSGLIELLSKRIEGDEDESVRP